MCCAENPCPEQGDIIQIKLSEHTEVLPKADGTGSTTMLVDTVFEMNYSTGQWTRLKKYKPITNTSWDSPPAAQSHTNVSLSLNNMFTQTKKCICIHIWAKMEHGADERLSRREWSSLYFCTAEMQDSSTNISVLFVGFLFILFLFIHLRFLSDTLVRGGESSGRVLLTRGTVCSLQRSMWCETKRAAFRIFLYECDIHSSSLALGNRFMICVKTKKRKRN